MSRLSAALLDIPQATVYEAVAVAEDAIHASSPSRLRGVGKRGAPLNVRHTITTTAENPAALVFGTGPWALIEFDTRAHREPRSTRRRRARQRVMVVPSAAGARGGDDPGLRTIVNHPGTKGQHVFERGARAAEPAIARLFQSQVEVAMRAIF